MIYLTVHVYFTFPFIPIVKISYQHLFFLKIFPLSPHLLPLFVFMLPLDSSPSPSKSGPCNVDFMFLGKSSHVLFSMRMCLEGGGMYGTFKKKAKFNLCQV